MTHRSGESLFKNTVDFFVVNYTLRLILPDKCFKLMAAFPTMIIQ